MKDKTCKGWHDKNKMTYGNFLSWNIILGKRQTRDEKEMNAKKVIFFHIPC